VQFKGFSTAKPSIDVAFLVAFDPRHPKYRGNAIHCSAAVTKGQTTMTIAANPESFVPLSKEGMEVKISEFKVKPAMTKESIRT